MPVLDLTDETVATEAGRCMVAAVMLAPADAALRHEIEASERLAGLADHVEGLPTIPGDHAARMVRDALAIRSHAEITADVRRLTVQGITAGITLAEVLAGRIVGEDVSISTVRERLRAGFDGFDLGNDFIRLRGRTLETVWQSYRPVAHLWAARYLLSVSGAIPCPACDLPQLLAVAEHCRREGERTRLPKSKAIALPGPAWTVPPVIDLPEVEITPT